MVPNNSALWTIPIELQFYFLLPFVLAFAKLTKKPLTAVSLILGAFLLFALALNWLWLGSSGAPQTPLQKLVLHSFIPYFYMFMCGVFIRQAELHKSRLLAGKGIYWAIACIVLAFALPINGVVLTITNLVLAMATISLAYTAPRLSSKLIGDLDISYGIYIYHGLMINVLIETGFRGAWSGFAMMVGGTCVAAWLSWTLIEKPALALVHRPPAPADIPARIEAVAVGA